MSNTEPVNSSQGSTSGVQSSGATQGASGTGAAADAEVTSATTISSLADLEKKAPKVYKAMLQGIAMNICNQMQHNQERLKKLMREGERDTYGG